MITSSFHPTLEQLPSELPVFPLTGILLLPRARLPMNIFEDRYLNMVQDVLGGDRMIGMIQPEKKGKEALYNKGCAGRITQFAETRDGRFLITLKGVCRFTLSHELEMGEGGYRRIVPDWSEFAGDLVQDSTQFNRDELIEHLKVYFQHKGIKPNWEAIEKRGDEELISSLSVVCPFEAREKQALLEVQSLSERAQLMMTLLEMGAITSGGGSGAQN
jgi:Lon protease-like protein